MDDIASLGFDIPSQPLADASRELDKFAQSAKKTERATVDLSTATKDLSAQATRSMDSADKAYRKAMEGALSYSKVTADLSKTTTRLANDNAVVTRSLGQYSAELATNRAAMQSVAKAADAADTSFRKIDTTITAGGGSGRRLGQYSVQLAQTAATMQTVAKAADAAEVSLRKIDTRVTPTRIQAITGFAQELYRSGGGGGGGGGGIGGRGGGGPIPGSGGFAPGMGPWGPRVQEDIGRTNTLLQGLRDRLGDVGKTLTGETAPAFQRFGGILTAYFGGREILKAIDDFTQLTNQLKVTGAEGSNLTYVMDRLFSSANKNGVEVNALAVLYSKASQASRELGASQDQILEFTDGVTAALRVQGTTSEKASGALLQLSQSLGSGKVRAEEFNSILEGAYPIAQAAARGMDGMGGSVAKLRNEVIKGNVTSKQFFDALLKGFPEIKRQAEETNLTIGAGATSVRNSFERFVGTMDKATGATNAIGSVLRSLGGIFDDLTKDIQTNAQWFQDLRKYIDATKREFQGIGEFFEKVDKWGKSTTISDWIQDQFDSLGDFVTDAIALVVNASAQFIQSMKTIPSGLKDMFVSGMNDAIEAVESGYNKIRELFGKDPTRIGRIGTGNTSEAFAGIRSAEMWWAGKQAEEGFRNQFGGTNAEIRARERERRALLNRQAGMEGDEARARLGGMPLVAPPDQTNLPPDLGKGADKARQSYAKLVEELTNSKAAQDKMTAAARGGEQAMEEYKATVDAQNKLLSIFGKTLDENDPKLTKVRDLLLDIARGKAAEAFNVATTELEKQNQLLEAQIALMNQSPEIQAREIALIKAKHEAEKAGKALTDADIEARRKAIEINERLKIQQEELKKSQELWTAPLKQALQDIQSTAASAFEEILNSGKISFESLGQTFKKIITRMAAEFLALATLRPVMNVVVNAVGGQNTAGVGGSGGLGGSTQGGGLLDMLSGNSSGGGGLLSGIFDGSAFQGAVPSQAGVMGPQMPGALSASRGFELGSFGGAGAISGGLGIASGAIGLATDKNPTTASTLGNVGMMVGGALMMVPTGFTQIAGAIIMAASAILPGLFGGKPEPPTNRTYASIAYGQNGFASSGGAWGPDANSTEGEKALMGAGGNIDKVFQLLGGVKDAGKVWGLAFESMSKKGDGWDLESTSSFLTGPGGTKENWRMNMDNMLESGSAQVAVRSILEGATGEITQNMRQVLEKLKTETDDLTLEGLAEAITEVKAFDEAIASLGKTITPMQEVMDGIANSFQSLYDIAEKYDLSTTEIDTEKNKQWFNAIQDFGKSITDATLEITDPKQAALNALDKERKNLVDQNDYIVKTFGETHNKMTEIEAYYGAKRAQIVEQYAAEATAAMQQAVASATSSINSLQDLIRQLSPGGALANLDPAGQYAGLSATYRASYAQAWANPLDAGLIARSVSDAQAFLEYSQRFNAGDPNYNRDRDLVLQQAQSLQLAAAQGAGQQLSGTAGATLDPSVVQMFQQLATAIMTAANQNNQNSATARADVDRLVNLLTSLITNGRRAA